MMNESIHYIIQEVNYKIDREELISLKLLTKYLFSKYGIRINEKDLELYLKKNDEIIQVSKGIFVPSKVIEQFHGDDEKIINHLKNKYFILYPDLSSLQSKQNQNQEAYIQFEDSNHSNEYWIKEDGDNSTSLDENHDIIKQVVEHFENYYKKYKRAVDINNTLFNAFKNVSRYRVLECLQDKKIFYQLTKKRFALNKWIIDDLFNYFEKNFNPIDIYFLEERARKLLRTRSVNRKNLYSQFFKGKKKIDKVMFLEIKTTLYNYLDTITNKNNQCEHTKNNSTLKDLLDIPKTLEEIAIALEIRNDIYKINKLELILSTNPNIIIDENNRYLYLHNGDEKASLHSLINKINVKHTYIISTYNVDELIERIMRYKKKPIKEEELIGNLNYIVEVEDKQVISILTSNEKFIRTGYDEWFLREISNFPEFKGDFIKTLSGIEKKIGKKYWNIYMEYTLKSGTTLQTVGDKFKLTRERVRQINKKVEKKLNNREYKSVLLPYITYLQNTLFNKSRVLRIEDIALNNKYSDVFGGFNIKKLINFFSNLNYVENKKITLYNDKFLINMNEQELYFLSRSFSRRFIKAYIDSISLDEVYDFFCSFHLKNKDFIITFLNDNFNMHLISESNVIFIKDSKINKSDFTWYILKKNGEPMHYSEVAEKFKELTGEQDIKDRNILGLLDRTPGAIRIFSGLFALKEWGVIPHRHTKDWNYKVLKEKGKPLHYTDIYSEVSKYTLSKEKTVYANLNTDDRIFTFSNGYYGLREWIKDREKVVKFNITQEMFQQNTRTRKLIDTFINNSGYYTSKYYLSDYAIQYGYLKIPTDIRNFLSKQLYLLDYNNNRYFITFSDQTSNLYRLTALFRDKGLEPNKYIYLEFISDNLIRFFTENEFNNYKEFNLDTINDFNILKKLEDKKSLSRTDINTPKDIKEFGLIYGYVYYEDVQRIAHSIDDINDFLDELADIGIVFKGE